MLELLGDSLVKAGTALVVLPIILIAVMGLVVVILIQLTRARQDIIEKEPWKYERYEAANPLKYKEARTKVSMQYLGYLIMFLAVEPAVVLLAILMTAPRDLLGSMLIIYGVFLAVYAPLLAYAVREARRIQSWMLD
ncbi:MAG: NADH-quinone oxidoreductase subunit A [Desulfurococcales archaeon]|nr:NADH-quinone oxidoreductase subunit A [Desulfurococcales archaeon]